MANRTQAQIDAYNASHPTFAEDNDPEAWIDGSVTLDAIGIDDNWMESRFGL